MRLGDYDERDGKRVWLSQTEQNNEVTALIDEAKSPEQEIAFRLGAQAGLRRIPPVGGPEHVTGFRNPHVPVLLFPFFCFPFADRIRKACAIARHRFPKTKKVPDYMTLSCKKTPLSLPWYSVYR